MLAYFCMSEVQFILSKDSANREICKKMLAYFCKSEVQFILAKDGVERAYPPTPRPEAVPPREAHLSENGI